MLRCAWLNHALLFAAVSCSVATSFGAKVAAQAEAPAELAAPNPAQLVWKPEWPRFRTIGYGLTGLSVAGALTATFLVPYPERPRWTGGILFDDAARNALRARDPGVRDGIRLASDITLITTIVHVALIDSLIVPLARHSPDVAWQLSLINAQAFSLNILIATLLFKTAARARPSYAQCQADPHFDPLCASTSLASFPSSHTSTAFTAAGLTCVHHQYLPIYGAASWDATACIGSLAFATATGLFRLIGDRHYASDVLMGALTGFALGYIYPWLLHYRYAPAAADRPTAASNEVRWGMVPGASSAPYGMSLAGEF
jgi:membrane-associated phospholipid phosphatase